MKLIFPFFCILASRAPEIPGNPMAAGRTTLNSPERKPMAEPVIITVAITGALPRKKDNPAVPVTPSEQIESTHEAYEAGASLVHIHVRNPDESPSSDPELYGRVQEGVRKHCPGISSVRLKREQVQLVSMHGVLRHRFTSDKGLLQWKFLEHGHGQNL